MVQKSIKCKRGDFLNPTSLLQITSAIHQKYDLLYQKTGAHFNIFNIINISQNEVAICRVLYELLSPNGNHFQGHIYLKLFVERVLGLHISSSELESAKVYREYVINSNRRIDLVIETSERFIPIEVKVYALDQPGQCYNYYQEAKKHISVPVLYYLTLFGVNPSENSTKGLIKRNEQYEGIKTISFSVDILDWLNLCIQEINTLKIASIREVILQFISVIRQLTEQIEVDIEMEIKELLLSSSDNMRSATAIQKSLEQAKKTFIEKLFTAVSIKVGKVRLMNEYDYSFENYKRCYSFYRRNSTSPGIAYLYKSNVKNNIDIWVRMAIEDVGIYVGYCCPTNQKAGEQPLLEEEIQTILGVEPWIDKWWAYWEFCPNNNQDDCPDFLNMNEAYFKLFDEKNFIKFVDNCAERILSLLTGDF